MTFLKWLVFIGLQVLLSTIANAKENQCKSGWTVHVMSDQHTEAGEDLVEAQKAAQQTEAGDPVTLLGAKWKVFVGKNRVVKMGKSKSVETHVIA